MTTSASPLMAVDKPSTADDFLIGCLRLQPSERTAMSKRMGPAGVERKVLICYPRTTYFHGTVDDAD
jgi:hypothetical protein